MSDLNTECAKCIFSSWALYFLHTAEQKDLNEINWIKNLYYCVLLFLGFNEYILLTSKQFHPLDLLSR